MKNIIEENYEKEGIKNSIRFASIRKEIKTLSAAQMKLKPQRKTVNFKGERTLPVWNATEKVMENRYYLRHLYIAYAVLKEVDRPKVTKKEISKSLVDKYITKYTYKE